MRGHSRQIEARVHSSPTMQTSLAGNHLFDWRRSRCRIFRCTALAFRLSNDLSHFGNRLRVSSAPRYLVFSADVPNQLVATDNRDHTAELPRILLRIFWQTAAE